MAPKDKDTAAKKKPKATKKAAATKRKTPASTGRKKASSHTTAAAATTAASAPTTTATAAAATPQPSVAPSHVLVIDNGGDTIKYGWSTDEHPQTLPNVTARLQQQWTVLAGDQLATIQNPNQLIGVTRSTERGIVVNLGNQIQVWKRMLDILGVAIPLTTDTAQAFGWKQTRGAAADAELAKIPAASCAVILTIPPHCPRTILDQITLIWMEDLGFSHVGFVTAQLAATHAATPRAPAIAATCVVDVGWSACTVVPTYRHKVPDARRCIRRLPLGGRHLINMCKYFFSYRQWNLMDQEWILRDVLEKTGYVSLQFGQEMQIARKLPPGRRPFDREFLLPDYQSSFEGQVHLPPALQQAENDEDEEEEEDDDEDDEDVREEDMNEEDVELDLNEEIEEPKEEKRAKPKGNKAAKRNKDDGDDDEDGDDDDDEDEEDDEEEDVETLRKRILKQREEERRRRDQEAERQALRLSVERFTVPEVLFRPSDGGLPREWPGLAGTVVQAIERCPEHLQAALYRSVRLVGGLSQLPNLKDRLEQELRSLVPCEYELSVTLSELPKEETWMGVKSMATSNSYAEWSISKEEWTNLGKRGAWRRLTHAEGGSVV